MATVVIKCETCKKEFSTKAYHKDRRKFCSMECRKTAPHLKKASEMTALATREKLTPAESGKIRAEIATYMRDQLTDAHLVVMGTKEWNPTQARVFGMLLNKVVPDLNHSFNQHEHTAKTLTDLSREELEAIAQGVSEIEVESIGVIEHEG
tara:strand:+ start:79 stop:531 length:453 start_codon:yes stop_codon:yes gene_type:complete